MGKVKIREIEIKFILGICQWKWQKQKNGERYIYAPLKQRAMYIKFKSRAKISAQLVVYREKLS